MAEITLADLAKARANQDTVETKNALVEEKEVDIQQAFSEEELQKIEEIKDTIDFTDSQMMIQYGVGSQRNLTDFTDSILTKVRSKDTGYVGDLLSELVIQVNHMDITKGEDEGILGKIPFLKNIKHDMEKMKERYTKVETQIDHLEGELEKARMEMLKDISMFDMMYQKNLGYFKELQLYIEAGEEKIQEMREVTLPKLREEAAKSGEPMDAQLVNDFEDTVNRFEKKLYDLKVSKTIAIQTAPQIKLIQNNDKLLVDKIQTAVLNTIPVWKSQIVIAIGLYRQGNALKLQQEISDTTNKLLTQNSDLLKTNTIETAKASEEGIVKVETLQKVNADLIATIDETIKIQKEGHEKRMAAEVELQKMEAELKNKLLEVRK